jgi:hypothetical protein
MPLIIESRMMPHTSFSNLDAETFVVAIDSGNFRFKLCALWTPGGLVHGRKDLDRSIKTNFYRQSSIHCLVVYLLLRRFGFLAI